MNISYFITGTDTGVGKSVTTAILAKHFKDMGFSVAVYKPIESGCGKELKSYDSIFIKEFANVFVFNRYALKEPLSPHLASKIDNIEIDIELIKQDVKSLKSKFDVLLVEGAGGVCVPINYSGFMMANLIKELELTTIIVSSLKLGVINHTILTIEYLKSIKANIKGIIFNKTSPIDNSISQDNIDIILKATSAKMLGLIEYKYKSFKLSKSLNH